MGGRHRDSNMLLAYTPGDLDHSGGCAGRLKVPLSHTNTHSLSLTHTHTHTLSLSLSHTHTHTHTSTHTHAHTRTHTHTHTHTITLAHNHTHTQSHSRPHAARRGSPQASSDKPNFTKQMLHHYLDGPFVWQFLRPNAIGQHLYGDLRGVVQD